MSAIEKNQAKGTPVSVFAANREKMFERMRITITFVGRLVGGTPKDPKLVQGWLRKNMGVTDEEELTARTRDTLLELAGDDEEMRERLQHATSVDELFEASEKLAAELQTQGFKRDESGQPYIEGRQVKALIKESVNILFAKEKWGRTGKGPKNYTAERVFVDDDRIFVGEPGDVGVDLAVGHISGPRGPQSTIGYYEFVEGATISFDVLQLISKGSSTEESLDTAAWGEVWAHAELNGLGAMRSQGFGRFVVVEFEIVKGKTKALKAV